jgi:predicted Zn finger-like uncharacterized protein
MQIQCPGCGARYRLNTGGTGRSSGRIRCPKCSRLFEVDLASTPSVPSHPPVSGDAGKVRPAPPSRTILVVDDARFFRELIVEVLAPLGLRVLTVADGAAALDLVRRERPQLVILDLNLPQMNGYELVRALRAEVGWEIKLLAMSGVFRKDEDISGIERAGADDFISKSFKPEVFLARVHKLLGDPQ